MIKFSIIIPVYNVEQYLEKCLDSVLKQTYKYFEVIIVCDKCSDNSEKIVDSYIKKSKKFKKIYAEHTGLAEAKNLGIEHVKGDYILFLDGDDYIERGLLEKINKNLTMDLDLIRFQARDILNNEKIEYLEKSFDTIDGLRAFDEIVTYHYIENSWLYAYRTSFWKKHNFKFMSGCIAEDYGLTPLIIASAETIKSISYIGYNYVQRENSLMNNKDYSKKIKKMDDMLLQASFIKNSLKNIENSNNIIRFINNSLIYYSTTLSKDDYKKYYKLLKEQRCFDYLISNNLKQKIKNFIIRNNPWFFYHHIAGQI